MNKYQEALELLKEYRIGVELNVVDKINYNARLEKIIDLLQELVDKATPKKLYTKSNMTNKICPSCHLIFGLDKHDRYEEHKHCPNCSQAIDWSNNED